MPVARDQRGGARPDAGGARRRDNGDPRLSLNPDLPPGGENGLEHVAHHLATLLAVVMLIGGGVGPATILQTRLMDVSGEAQVLPAALNHSAFNTANALGPWLGGLAIVPGWGWTSTGWIGVALALGGLAIRAVSWQL